MFNTKLLASTLKNGPAGAAMVSSPTSIAIASLLVFTDTANPLSAPAVILSERLSVTELAFSSATTPRSLIINVPAMLVADIAVSSESPVPWLSETSPAVSSA